MMEGRRKEIGAFTDDDSRCQTQPCTVKVLRLSLN